MKPSSIEAEQGIAPVNGEPICDAREAEAHEVLRVLRGRAVSAAPHFSSAAREELRTLTGSSLAVDVLEAKCRSEHYADGYQFVELKRQEAQFFREWRLTRSKPKRGKRARPQIEALAEDLAPVLILYGVPDACGENSQLVRALRLIAEMMGVKGEPRDVLRRERRREHEFLTGERHRAARELLQLRAKLCPEKGLGGFFSQELNISPLRALLY